VEVVLREVERPLRSADEVGDPAGDLGRRLAAVVEGAHFDHGGMMSEMHGLAERLAAARIGATFNQYAASPRLRRRLGDYLESRAGAPILLVGEAAGYRGARVSGIPFTSERQLTGSGPAEASATIVHRTLGELRLADAVLLWNLVPTHPGTERSNRRPTPAEIAAARPFLAELAQGRRVLAVGRLANAELGGPYVRHPAHGGAREFREGLLEWLA
jgi:uracil-DNA glycosylase